MPTTQAKQAGLAKYYDISKVKFILMSDLGNAQILGSVKQLTALGYLMREIWLNGGELKIAHEFIAIHCKISVATVRRAINYAIVNKLLDIHKDFICNKQSANHYILTNKSTQVLNKYYAEMGVQEHSAACSNLNNRYNSLKYTDNNKSVVSGQGDNTDFIISQERLIKTTIDDCPEIQEAILIAPIDEMNKIISIKQADLTRAMVHHPKLSLLCLVATYWYNKFGTRAITNPSAFFAWLRWKASKTQQQEFVIKGFNCFNLRIELAEYKQNSELKAIAIKHDNCDKINDLIAPIEVQDLMQKFVKDSPILDARLEKQYRIVKSQVQHNLSIEKSRKFNEIKPLGMVNGCLILRASSDEILIFSKIHHEFLLKFQSENMQIQSIKFIKTGE